ncbi:glutaredoxin, partial [Chytriomyces sp. MP71]
STRDIAEAFISSHNVSVFSKSGCPYCARAKLLLTSYETSFTAMELDLRHDGADIQDYLEEKTGQRTVPNIFLQQIHVGGCDALNRLDADGKLRDMLA